VKITAVNDVVIENPLKRSSQNSVSRGPSIRFNSDHWREICSTAENVLVSNSRQSHSSEVDNNN
jgi:hypothetical protein